MLAKMRVKRWPPRHKLKADAVITQRPERAELIKQMKRHPHGVFN